MMYLDGIFHLYAWYLYLTVQKQEWKVTKVNDLSPLSVMGR